MTRQRPIVLGIVGDSAAGKSTISRGLANILGPERVTHLCTDDYHKYDRRERAHNQITPLHPDCNYLDVLELHLERLHYGQPILKPVYDHSTGSLVRPEYVQPREFVIDKAGMAHDNPVRRQAMQEAREQRGVIRLCAEIIGSRESRIGAQPIGAGAAAERVAQHIEQQRLSLEAPP